MVDRFLEQSSLITYAVYRKGEPLLESKAEGTMHKVSGFKADVSDTDLDNLTSQIEEAISYLEENGKELKKLREFPGVEELQLDFGFNKRDEFCQYDKFPAKLLFLAGSLGIDIELSQFPAVESENAEQ